MQNNVKFLLKSYRYYPLRWYVSDRTSPGDDNARAFYLPLIVDLFINENSQFKENLARYHFVKFNYFAVKCHELAYIGYTGPEKVDGQMIGIGVNAMEFKNMPFYLCWDIEEDIKFGKTAGTVDITSLSQYFLTKKKTPDSRAISFVYKVPQPWRQFFSTSDVKSKATNVSIESFFESICNYNNLRSPKALYGGHIPWWTDIQGHTDVTPSDPNNFVYGKTLAGFYFYVSVTFRGRKVMSIV